MRKVAIVTGANCGIGLAVVRQLCKQFRGDVYLTSRMSDKGKAAVELLRKEGLNPLFHELDVSQPDSIRMFEEFIMKNYGGVDIIVNNAAVHFEKDKVPVYRQAQLCLEVDFTGTLNMCKIFLPHLRPHARIVNLTNGYLAKKSALSKQAQSKLDISTMSLADCWLTMDAYVKAAKVGNHANGGWPESPTQAAKILIVAMTKVLSRDMKDDHRKNILINACCPGWTDTGGSVAYRGVNGICQESNLQTADEAAEDVAWVATIRPGQDSPNGEVLRNRKVISCDF